MRKEWALFRKAVQEHLETILTNHDFRQLTGREFESSDAEATDDVLFYENSKGFRMTVDIMKKQRYQDAWINFYWLRVSVSSVNLKSLRVPPPKTKDEVWEADGWVFNDIEAVDTVMKEIAEV